MNRSNFKASALILFAVSAASLSAQTNTFPSSGNVGIGTLTPQDKLHVQGGGIAVDNPTSEGARVRILNTSKTGATTSDWSIWNMTGPYGNGLSFWRYYANGTNVGPAVWFGDNGNVGIGTTAPGSSLEVMSPTPLLSINGSNTSGFRGVVYQLRGSAFSWDRADAASGEFRREVGPSSGWGGFQTFYTDSSERMRITSSGNVGIGTITPATKLEVLGGVCALPATSGTTQQGASARFGNPQTNGVLDIGVNSGTGAWLQYTNRGDLSQAYPLLLNPNGGNVGIGTTNPGANKLAVNGTIRAKEVIVDTGWSDYVFASDYTLAPLSEVEAHIKAHHTLPGVPSEAQVAKEGISVGDMQSKLLAKIEELTLHLIAQEKQQQLLMDRVRALEAEKEKPRTRL